MQLVKIPCGSCARRAVVKVVNQLSADPFSALMALKSFTKPKFRHVLILVERATHFIVNIHTIKVVFQYKGRKIIGHCGRIISAAGRGIRRAESRYNEGNSSIMV